MTDYHQQVDKINEPDPLDEILKQMSIDTVRTWENPALNQAATVEVWLKAKAAINVEIAKAVREARVDIKAGLDDILDELNNQSTNGLVRYNAVDESLGGFIEELAQLKENGDE